VETGAVASSVTFTSTVSLASSPSAYVTVRVTSY
jgi:hypothetical protein